MDTQDESLQRRLRENRGRVRRAEVAARVERALGSSVSSSDFVDLATSDRLEDAIVKHVQRQRPVMTWPRSRRSAVLQHIDDLGRSVGDHISCLTGFRGSDETGALRARSVDLCTHASEIWDEGAEPFCLVSKDLLDGLYLDYTEPIQMGGQDEYELWLWGRFARLT